VDPHQLLCPWFTVVFVLFCIYTPDNLFPRPIVNLVGGLFWILLDSIVTSPENTYPRGKHGEINVHRSSACEQNRLMIAYMEVHDMKWLTLHVALT
jgi:hypothetical protein